MRFNLLILVFFSFLISNSFSIPSFPGAQGFGAITPGGRGGKVIKVTNLNDSGPGSLRDAVQNQTGPRIIVFEVGGVIEVGKTSHLGIEFSAGDGFVTIAGQTAPGGITLSGGQLGNRYGTGPGPLVADIIVRHMRFRGVHNTAVGETYGTRPLDWYKAHRIMVDHISASWGCDQTVDFYSNCIDNTMQWSIVGEAANGAGQWCGGHPEGSHNFGQTSGANGSDRQTMHHVMYLHNSNRNPSMSQWNEPFNVDLTNIVDYNCEICVALHAGSTVSGTITVNLQGNYWKKGLDSPGAKGYGPTLIYVTGNVESYFDDNFYEDATTGGDPWSSNADPKWYSAERMNRLSVSPIQYPKEIEVTVHPAKEGKDLVLKNGGAFPRDKVDERFVQEFKTGTGRYHKVENDLTNPLMGIKAPKDSDNDGMPDVWESANGLDPNTADDKGDHDGDGYTNIEEYINDVAEILVNNPTQNPTGGVESVYNPNYSAGVTGLGPHGSVKQTGVIIQASPNPFVNTVTIEIGITGTVAGTEKISIFNIVGKLVYDSQLTAGRSQLVWNGTNQFGESVSPGVYLVQIKNGNKLVGTQRLVMMH